MIKNYKSWLSAGAVLLSVTGLAGCGANGSGQPVNVVRNVTDANKISTSQVITDGMGHKVKIPANPQRIWAPALEDPIVALGDAKKLVGQYSSGDVVDTYLQKWLKGKPHIDLTGNGLNPESVLSLNPDLILLFASGLAADGKYQQYSQIAPTYVFNVTSGSQAAWRQELLTLGQMLHQTAKAEQVLHSYDQQVKAAKQKLYNSVGKKTVAIIEPSGKDLFLIGPGVFAGQEVYGDLGLTAPKLAKGWGQMSLESLPELHADYIFVVTGNDSTSELQELESNPVWKGLPAVQQGHDYQVSYGNWINNGAIANGITINDVLKDIR